MKFIASLLMIAGISVTVYMVTDPTFVLGVLCGLAFAAGLKLYLEE